jgi:hypothetical protein
LHWFEKGDDELIKSHMSKGTDKKAFATLATILNRERFSLYKKYKRICEHQVRHGNVPKYRVTIKETDTFNVM